MKKLIFALIAILMLSSQAYSTAVSPVISIQRSLGIWGDWTVTWSSITTTNNTCTQYVEADKFSAMTVQILGTWNGATVTLFGSNDSGTTWFPLIAVETAAAISMTSNDQETVLNTPSGQVKWVLAGGGVSTSLKVIIKGQR